MHANEVAKSPVNQTNSASNLVPWDEWLRGMGLDKSTGFRYRQRGLLSVCNIFGRIYITRAEIANFEARVLAGDFAKQVRSNLPRKIAGQ